MNPYSVSGNMTHEQLTTDFGNSFQSLLHSYDVCMQRTLRKYGLYPGQPQLLFQIRRMHTPTQNQLAETMGLSRASIGVSLRRLEASGFVKRVRDRKDSRCIRIHLTQKGEEYIRWCEIDFEMLFTTMLESFRSDEREEVLGIIQRMERSLDRFKERLDR